MNPLTTAPRKRVFLSARWQALAMINFSIEPTLLEPLVPKGTSLDLFGGVAYLSVVGFLFRDTRLLGLPVPWHINFEEVNLRFYVQRTVGHEVRRGVCFVKELVPRWAIANVEEFIAEHYWGYCGQRDGGTVEYEVEHPPWNVWQATPEAWQGDVPGFYGEPWAGALRQPPSSAFLADGSAVKVFRPTRIS